MIIMTKEVDSIEEEHIVKTSRVYITLQLVEWEKKEKDLVLNLWRVNTS